MRRRLPRALIVAAAPALAGCEGAQSWLAPAGLEAAAVAELFWVMLAGAVVIWVGVIGAMIYASRVEPGPHSPRLARRFVIWGGMALPVVTLAALLAFGLGLMREATARPAELSVEALGERWWFRMSYEGPDGPVAVPNELRLPVGRTVEIAVTGDDVIHSFWAPALGGKMDMIPGRVNRLRLTPTEPGAYRGACAEFCGEAHAQMNFAVVVMAEAEWADWLAAQARPARAPATEAERAGLDLFLELGCGACHRIRGTEAEGRVGPDLTHVASRMTIGAGLLPTTAGAFKTWIAETERVKPGVRMPSYGMLGAGELEALAAYMMSLE
jgi:cytochrome c oxidase subunit 2